MAHITAKTKTGYQVEMSLEELNGITNLSQDHFDFGDVIDVTSATNRLKFLEQSCQGVNDLVSQTEQAIQNWKKAQQSGQI